MRVVVGVVKPALERGVLRDRFARRRERRALLRRLGDLVERCYPAVTLRERSAWMSEDGGIALLGLADEPAESWFAVSSDGRRAVVWSGFTTWRPAADPSLAELEEPGGHALRIVADATGLAVLHGAAGLVPVASRRVGDVTVVSNRVPIAHLLGSPDAAPTVDPERVTTLLGAGFVFGRDHPLEATELLEPGEVLRVRRDGTQEVSRRPTSRGPLGVEDAASRIAGRMVDVCRSLPSQEPGDLRCGVTAGRDSRIVIAAVHRSGRPYLAFTSGRHDSANVQVGARITALLGVEHHVEPPAERRRVGGGELVEVDVVARTVEAIRRSDGLVYGYDNLTPFGPWRRFVVLGGAGGELHRGGLRFGRPDPTPDEVRSLLGRRFWYGRDLLRAPGRAYLSARLARWRKLAAEDPAGVLDAIYTRWRTGRWVAGTHLSRLSSRLVVLPFLDDVAVELAARVPFDDRASERLHHAILHALVPELTHLPFDKPGYHFQRASGAPTPEPVRSSLSGGFSWRRTLGPQAREVFRDAILDGGADAPLWEVLDRRATEARLAEDDPDHRLWWRLLTLRLVVDGHPWRGDPPTGATVRIPVPVESG